MERPAVDLCGPGKWISFRIGHDAMDMTGIIDWLQSLQWEVLVSEWAGKALGVMTGFVVSWFVLVRRRMKALERMQRGGFG